MESFSPLELALIFIPIVAALISVISTAYVLYKRLRSKRQQIDLDPPSQEASYAKTN